MGHTHEMGKAMAAAGDLRVSASELTRLERKDTMDTIETSSGPVLAPKDFERSPKLEHVKGQANRPVDLQSALE